MCGGDGDRKSMKFVVHLFEVLNGAKLTFCFVFVAFQAICNGYYVGAIVCKLDQHGRGINRGYIAMLTVDKAYRRRRVGKHAASDFFEHVEYHQPKHFVCRVLVFLTNCRPILYFVLCILITYLDVRVISLFCCM